MATAWRARLVRLLLGATPLFLAVALAAGCARTVEGIPVGGSATTPTGSTQAPPGGPLQAGDCVMVVGFVVVNCAQPHELEVYHFAQLPPGFPADYPAAGTLLPRFEPQCRTELTDYLGGPDADASRLREFVYWPSPQGWAVGERWMLCAAVEIGPDDRPLRRTGALAGALRGGLGPFQACAQDPPSQGPLHIVPCQQPHRGEAVPGVLVLGASTDPPVTEQQANAVAEPHCRRAIDTFLGTPSSRPALLYSWRYPLPESWENGYTAVVCYAETATRVTGSLRSN